MIALLARLKIAHKLLISCAVLALPIVLLLYSVVSGYSEGIRSARKELEGARRLEPLQRLAEDVRVHQRLDYLRFHGDLRWEAQRKEAARRIDEVLAGEAAPELSARWQQLRTHSPATADESVAAHQQLADAVQTLVGNVGDSSKLILDPDMDSYYLVELAVVLLPRAQATIADAGMLADEAALGQQLSQPDLLDLAADAARLERFTLPQARHAAETSLREDPNYYGVSESLQQNLPRLFRRYDTEMAVCAEQMLRYSRTQDSSLMAPQLAAAADRAAQAGSFSPCTTRSRE
jgi:methyl-accepting chemotaxis protein